MSLVDPSKITVYISIFLLFIMFMHSLYKFYHKIKDLVEDKRISSLENELMSYKTISKIERGRKVDKLLKWKQRVKSRKRKLNR